MAHRVLLVAIATLAAATAKTTPVTNATVATRACQGAFLALPYCNTALPLDERVEDFIQRLWANESWVPPQLTARHGGGGNPGPTSDVPELGLPDYDFGLNAIHGTQSGCVSQGGVTYCPTSFMNPVNFGATWNDSQVTSMAAVIAEETRALWLAGAGEESSWSGRPHIGLDVWSPNMSVAEFFACCLLPAACCLLACCLLPACMLPAACCLLPAYPRSSHPHTHYSLPLAATLPGTLGGGATWRWPRRSP
jgi:hypothetical protein